MFCPALVPPLPPLLPPVTAANCCWNKYDAKGGGGGGPADEGGGWACEGPEIKSENGKTQTIMQWKKSKHRTTGHEYQSFTRGSHSPSLTLILQL